MSSGRLFLDGLLASIARFRFTAIISIKLLPPRMESFIVSAQEFDETRILGCFPENREFGFGGGHALGFEQQVAEVFIPTARA
jgi:hypothetical protein